MQYCGCLLRAPMMLPPRLAAGPNCNNKLSHRGIPRTTVKFNIAAPAYVRPLYIYVPWRHLCGGFFIHNIKVTAVVRHTAMIQNASARHARDSENPTSPAVTHCSQVKALYGAKGGGGVRGAQIAVCTIEKANSLVNRMAAADVREGIVSWPSYAKCVKCVLFFVWRPRATRRLLQHGSAFKEGGSPARWTSFAGRHLASALFGYDALGSGCRP